MSCIMEVPSLKEIERCGCGQHLLVLESQLYCPFFSGHQLLLAIVDEPAGYSFGGVLGVVKEVSLTVAAVTNAIVGSVNRVVGTSC